MVYSLVQNRVVTETDYLINSLNVCIPNETVSMFVKMIHL